MDVRIESLFKIILLSFTPLKTFDIFQSIQEDQKVEWGTIAILTSIVLFNLESNAYNSKKMEILLFQRAVRTILAGSRRKKAKKKIIKQNKKKRAGTLIVSVRLFFHES